MAMVGLNTLAEEGKNDIIGLLWQKLCTFFIMINSVEKKNCEPLDDGKIIFTTFRILNGLVPLRVLTHLRFYKS